MSAIPLVLLSTVLHAGWNLLARALRADQTFLRATLLTTVAGVPAVLLVQGATGHFPPAVWGLLALAGICQAVYYLGLTRGYQGGDFSLVYPLARSLPILLLALIDLGRGRAPSLPAWLGMALVMLGCLALPLGSMSGSRLAGYWNSTIAWIVITALGTVGYTTVDKIAAEMIAPGAWSAAAYQVWENAFSLLPLWLLLAPPGRRARPSAGGNGQNARREWLLAGLAAVAIFAAYWLVLWAYQTSPFASYIVATRQLSIVIGVAAGIVLWREPAPAWRLGASLTILAGVVCIALAA